MFPAVRWVACRGQGYESQKPRVPPDSAPLWEREGDQRVSWASGSSSARATCQARCHLLSFWVTVAPDVQGTLSAPGETSFLSPWARMLGCIWPSKRKQCASTRGSGNLGSGGFKFMYQCAEHSSWVTAGAQQMVADRLLSVLFPEQKLPSSVLQCCQR